MLLRAAAALAGLLSALSTAASVEAPAPWKAAVIAALPSMAQRAELKEADWSLPLAPPAADIARDLAAQLIDPVRPADAAMLASRLRYEEGLVAPLLTELGERQVPEEAAARERLVAQAVTAHAQRVNEQALAVVPGVWQASSVSLARARELARLIGELNGQDAYLTPANRALVAKADKALAAGLGQVARERLLNAGSIAQRLQQALREGGLADPGRRLRTERSSALAGWLSDPKSEDRPSVLAETGSVDPKKLQSARLLAAGERAAQKDEPPLLAQTVAALIAVHGPTHSLGVDAATTPGGGRGWSVIDRSRGVQFAFVSDRPDGLVHVRFFEDPGNLAAALKPRGVVLSQVDIKTAGSTVWIAQRR